MALISKRTFAMIAVISSTALSACEPPSFSFAREGVRVWGTKPLVDRDKFERIDLAKEILAATPTRHSPSMEIDDALRLFYISASHPELKIGRDRIQERILGASKQRCGVYRNFLKEFDAQSNFILGSLTTTLAGAGAIFTGVDAVRALSGSASILSGIRSELNEDYFHALTIQVIADGFGARREEIYKGIRERQGQDIAEYTLEAAIKDAVEYHENCSLLAGLEHAAKSIERARDPGLMALSEAATKIQVFRNRLRDAVDDDDIKVRPINIPTPAGEEGAGATDGGTEPAQIAKVPGDALVAYIQAKKTRDTLASEKDKYKGKTLTNLAITKYERHGTISGGKSCPAAPPKLSADPTATAADIHASELLLVQQCENIVKDRTAAQMALKQDDSKEKTIVTEITAVLAEADGLFSEEARGEYEKLEADRIPLLANAKTAAAGSPLVTATAELKLHEAKINSKIDVLNAAHKKLQNRLTESNAILEIIDGLKKRIEAYNDAVANLLVRVGKQTVSNSDGNNGIQLGKTGGATQAKRAPLTRVDREKLKNNKPQ